MIPAVALILLPGAVAAQNNADNQTACMSDAMTYCTAYVPNERLIELCLRRNRARISAACQTALGPPPRDERRPQRARRVEP